LFKLQQTINFVIKVYSDFPPCRYLCILFMPLWVNLKSFYLCYFKDSLTGIQLRRFKLTTVKIFYCFSKVNKYI